MNKLAFETSSSLGRFKGNTHSHDRIRDRLELLLLALILFLSSGPAKDVSMIFKSLAWDGG